MFEKEKFFLKKKHLRMSQYYKNITKNESILQKYSLCQEKDQIIKSVLLWV